jgi:autotransporter-associated beta strand protein
MRSITRKSFLTKRGFIPSAIGLLCVLAAKNAVAAPSIYFDINGTTTGSGVATGGSYSWESAFWDGTSGGTGAAINFVEGDFARFAAGTDAGSKSYTITATSDHLIGGMFLQSNGGGTVTINGPGTLIIDATGGPVQGFLVNSASQTLMINASLGGSGGVQNQLSGSLDLYGNNSYSGGTVLGTSAGLNFNNNNSFGTGGITWGVAQQVLANDAATSPLTLNNTMTTRAASTLIYVGPAAAPVTFNNSWTLASGTSTVTIGNGTHLSSKMTISGAIGGVGGNLIVNGTSGTMVLSGANTYNGTTTIGGTSRLVLGAANTIASSSSLVLGGGTVDPDGINQIMSSTTLGLTANSTLDYGSGASEVDTANSSALAWTGTLNLANWDASLDKLRIGIDSTGLMTSQLAEIEFNGSGLGTAGIDPNGYIYQVPEPSVAVLGLLGGLFFIRQLRRRKA